MITLAGALVLAGRVTFPSVGTWVATLELGADVAPTGQVELDDGAGSVFAGTVVRSNTVSTRAYADVVGGAGGLRRQQEPQHFRNTTVQQVIAGILAAASESPDPYILPSSVSTALGFWSTQQATGGVNLSSLCSEHGLIWRVRPAGGVWVGLPSEGLQAPGEAFLLDGDPAAGRYRCAPDNLWLLPGMTQSRGIVERVEYEIGEHLRALYWTRDG